jgi:hypothetical protein
MNETIKEFKVGADVEVFLRNNDWKFISAVGLIGGTKDNPKLLDCEGHMVQEDNVAAEFNIPPCTTAEDFVKHINISMMGVLDLLPSGLFIDLHASAKFDKDQLLSLQAQEFGCSIDYNAYTLAPNKKPCAKNNPTLRSIGGHLHCGYNSPCMTINAEMIYLLDLFLGVPSILLDPDTDRRQLYGKAGAFRPKDYGLEYRTLSSFWIANDELIKWAFRGVENAIMNINDKRYVTEKYREKVQECINNQDIELAKELIERYKIAMPKGYTVKELMKQYTL